MNEWMSEWMSEWMNEWVNEWMSEWMNEWMQTMSWKWCGVSLRQAVCVLLLLPVLAELQGVGDIREYLEEGASAFLPLGTKFTRADGWTMYTWLLDVTSSDSRS